MANAFDGVHLIASRLSLYCISIDYCVELTHASWNVKMHGNYSLPLTVMLEAKKKR
jgi:hypothetical protein